MAESLGALGSAMLGLAGGVVDSIASFLGSSDKMVDGINKFSEIDGTAVENLTASGGLAGLKALQMIQCKNVEDFADAIDKLVDYQWDSNANYPKITMDSY